MQSKFWRGVLLLVLSNFLQACTTTQVNTNQVRASQDNVVLGLAYLKKGNKIRAKEKLLLAYQELPQDPLVLDAMAYFWDTTQNALLAHKYYKKAYDVAPHNGAVLNNYAVFLCKQHEYQNAERLFLKAAQLPNYINTAKAYENAGVCALKAGEPANAHEYFTKALVN